MIAVGGFEVNLAAQNDETAPVGRMLIDKTYTGALVGKGVGQMISKRTENGIAVYFAIEEFEGSLANKKGGFTLLHKGEMSAAAQSLEITILTGSGSHDLHEISGKIRIIQQEGKHSYELEYHL
tara:strand:- start:120 stop:491 length:372 start_codon:yes stop_codon:yes gene_type:complete